MKKILECVPNFSEGRKPEILKSIASVIQSVEGARLLDIDPGKSTNRTVMTFVGEPEAVIDAAFKAIIRASELIDLSQHSGEHPRMGATDVCPFIPISGITLEEAAEYSHELARRVGKAGIPVYMYEAAARSEDRQNLATVRRGEYEGLEAKMKDPNWKPDYGPDTFNSSAGATVIGARDFLVAYNINLNTTSVRRANSIAFDIRERGRIQREGNPVTGKVVRDADDNPVRIPGELKHVKAIGWYIDEYDLAQISMNLTNIRETPLHLAFDACSRSAEKRGLRVTGSELIGLVPKSVMIEAGKHFLRKQRRSTGISEEKIIDIAVKSLGLNELKPFEPKKKIIEYLIDGDSNNLLVDKSLKDFAFETASDSPAPGGGSIAASVGAFAVALATMVANLSANKREWDDRVEEYSTVADQGQELLRRFLYLVDEDTKAFDGIMAAIRLPKNSDEEKHSRIMALEASTLYAIEIPLETLKSALESMKIISQMVESGNPNSVSDAGVAALCARAAGEGAYMNVLINLGDYKDMKKGSELKTTATEILGKLKKSVDKLLPLVYDKIG